MTSFLDKSRTVAPAGFNRWLVPPAALAVHLSIGQIYAYSVFNAPLTKILGITAPVPGDWSLATVGWVFSIALAVLGASAALFGTWMERVGPRKAMFAAAVCFGLGFLVAALPPQPVAAVSGQRRARRHRPRPGLHRPRFHADEMVSRQTRHGHRPGDYGLRRRRNAGLAALRRPDGLLQKPRIGRRGGNLPCARRVLFPLYDVRRVHHPRARARLETRRLHPQTGRQAGEREPRYRRAGGENAAVLPALLDTLPQRNRRHRRARPASSAC